MHHTDGVHVEAAMSGEGIRPAIIDDCPAIVACVRQAYAKYIVRIGAKPAPMLSHYPELIARGVIHVLEDLESGELRGLIVLWPADDAMFVDNVAVDPRYQNRGFGRQLMAFAEKYALSAGLTRVRLYTNETMTEDLAFYRRLGFEETERRMEEGYKRVFLRKTLT